MLCASALPHKTFTSMHFHLGQLKEKIQPPNNLLLLFNYTYLTASVLVLAVNTVHWDGRLHSDGIKQFNTIACNLELCHWAPDIGVSYYNGCIYNFKENWITRAPPNPISRSMLFKLKLSIRLGCHFIWSVYQSGINSDEIDFHH